MKKIILFAAAAAIALSALLGCSQSNEAGKTQNNDQTIEVYADLVEVLRAELDAMRKDQSAKTEAYEKKIRELEDKLELLMAEKPQDGTSDSGQTSNPDDEIPLTYEEADGEIIITGLRDKSIKILVIPDKIDGKPVTAIADNAFAGSGLTGVSIPNGVKSIGWFAFMGCVSLMSANVPESVGLIGYDAFANCRKLTLHCAADSYAEKYAKSYGISVVLSD